MIRFEPRNATITSGASQNGPTVPLPSNIKYAQVRINAHRTRTMVSRCLSSATLRGDTTNASVLAMRSSQPGALVNRAHCVASTSEQSRCRRDAHRLSHRQRRSGNQEVSRLIYSWRADATKNVANGPAVSRRYAAREEDTSKRRALRGEIGSRCRPEDEAGAGREDDTAHRRLRRRGAVHRNRRAPRSKADLDGVRTRLPLTDVHAHIVFKPRRIGDDPAQELRVLHQLNATRERV